MIKAVAHGPSGPAIILGLSADNVREIQFGHPIKVDIGKLIPRLDGVTISIVYGLTEAHIIKDMQNVGLVDDETIRRDDE